ncbi:MAG: hypothetical protein HFJ48_01225 [Clostridia bacterium]|nr:hypothetical protein [Clostridia bacterium]
MKIIEKEKYNLLVAEEGRILKEREKIENEEYLFKEAYLPKNITLEECKKKFIEGDEK